MKLRSVETAMKADVSKLVPNAVDAMGIFDNLIQPVFPFPLPELSIILSFEEMEGPTMYEVRINSPEDELISKGSFGVLPDPMGYGRKVINLGAILIPLKGNYTVDVFEIAADQKLRFIKTDRLFTADYPPQRQISDTEKEAILADENLIKVVKTEFKPMEFANDPNIEPVKVQISLDENQPLEEGYIALPEDDMIEINGKKFEMTGMRRHIEWMFGQPIPKQEDLEKNTNEIHEENKN
ncbi:MAG: hypothetical protein IJG31_06090 [Fusobacterium sp.]|nr:hypothetical protein [Fusobacterium sp.]